MVFDRLCCVIGCFVRISQTIPQHGLFDGREIGWNACLSEVVSSQDSLRKSRKNPDKNQSPFTVFNSEPEVPLNAIKSIHVH